MVTKSNNIAGNGSRFIPLPFSLDNGFPFSTRKTRPNPTKRPDPTGYDAVHKQEDYDPLAEIQAAVDYVFENNLWK